MSVSSLETVNVQLGKLLKHVWASRTTVKERMVMSWTTENGYIALNREGEEAFRKAIVLLFGIKEIADRVSPKTIWLCVRDEVNRLSRGPRNTIETDSAESAKRLLSRLVTYPVEDFMVNLPVFGLEIWPDWLEFQVGDVLLYCVASMIRKTQSSRWFYYVDRDELRRDFDYASEGVKPSWGSNYWAKVNVLANSKDSDRLHSEATTRVRESLALLALFSFAYPASDWRSKTYLDFEPILRTTHVRYIDRWCCVVEHSVDEQYDAYPLFGWERQIDRYHISDDVLSSFKKEGFDGCCRILQRTTSRPIDIRIRRALEYFGYGMGMDNIHQRYVTYVASLEALLLGDNERRGIDRKLSYRISCLLEQDASKRERLRGSIEWLYGLRCRIVHGASPAPAEVAVGLTSLRWALYSLLRRLATNPDNFSSVDDIAKWTKAQLG